MISSGSGAKEAATAAAAAGAAPPAAPAQQQAQQQQALAGDDDRRARAIEALALIDINLAGLQVQLDRLASMLASTPNTELARLYAQAFVAASKDAAALTAEKRLLELVRDGAVEALIAAQRLVVDAARAAAPPPQQPSPSQDVGSDTFPLWPAACRHFHGQGGGLAPMMGVGPSALATVSALLAPLQAPAADKRLVVRPLGRGDVDDVESPAMPKRTHARNEDVRVVELPAGVPVKNFDRSPLINSNVLLLRPTMLTALEPIARALLTADKPLTADEDAVFRLFFPKHLRDYSTLLPVEAVERITRDGAKPDAAAVTGEDAAAMSTAVTALSEEIKVPRVAVVAGTSGIGKSTAINYLLLLFAALRRPIAVYMGGKCYYMDAATGAVTITSDAPNCHVLYEMAADSATDTAHFTLHRASRGFSVAFMPPAPLLSTSYKRFNGVYVLPVHEWSVAELSVLAKHIDASKRGGLSDEAVLAELRKRHVWLGGNLRELMRDDLTVTEGGQGKCVGMARIGSAFSVIARSSKWTLPELLVSLGKSPFLHLHPLVGRAFVYGTSDEFFVLLVPTTTRMVRVVTSLPHKTSEPAVILAALRVVVVLLGMRSVKGLAYEELFLTWATDPARAEAVLDVLVDAAGGIEKLTLPAGGKLEIVYAATDPIEDVETYEGLETVSAALKRPLTAGTEGRLVVPVLLNYDATYDFLLVLREERKWGLQLKSGDNGPFVDPFAAARADAFAAAKRAGPTTSKHLAWRVAHRAGLNGFIPVTFVRPDDDKTRPLIVLSSATLSALPATDLGAALGGRAAAAGLVALPPAAAAPAAAGAAPAAAGAVALPPAAAAPAAAGAAPAAAGAAPAAAGAAAAAAGRSASGARTATAAAVGKNRRGKKAGN